MPAQSPSAKPKPLAHSLDFLKPAVFSGSIVPLAVLAIRAAKGLLSAEPISEILNQFGLLALIFLVATLACSPLKTVFGWTWPLRVRKMLGLFAFFYALLHFLTYLVLDQGLDLSVVIADILKRKFIFVGFAAFVLMIPLAWTSTQSAIRRMGAKKWQRLHKLTYLVAILGAIHFYWRVKIDVSEPLIYAGIFATLLGIRCIYALRKRA